MSLHEAHTVSVNIPRPNKPAFLDALDDAEFTGLGAGNIAQLYHMFDNDAYIQSASTIMLNALLNGGISIHHSHASQASRNDSFAREQSQSVWGRWARDLMRSIWTVGFAASIVFPADPDDPMSEPEPRILDLTQLDIKFKQDISGRCIWRYFQRQVGPRSVAFLNHSINTPIADVQTYVYTSVFPPVVEHCISRHKVFLLTI